MKEDGLLEDDVIINAMNNVLKGISDVDEEFLREARKKWDEKE